MSRWPTVIAVFFSLFWLATYALAAEILPDPMRPPVVLSKVNMTHKTVTGYELSSTFISPTRRAAIINGRNVTIGDRVGSAKVVEIQATEVVINIAGKARTLTLLPVSIKKPAEASR